MNTKYLAILGMALIMAVSLAVERAPAVINPKFTPIHLLQQSADVLELRLPPSAEGKVEATVKRVIKGKSKAKTLMLDLSRTAYTDQAEGLEKLIAANGNDPVLFFSAEMFQEGDAPPGGMPGMPPGMPPSMPPGMPPGMPPDTTGPKPGPVQLQAYLHIAGVWVAFHSDAANANQWIMDKTSNEMLGTWNGGSDMLLQAVDYILANKDANLPVIEGVRWAERSQFTTLSDPIRCAMPVWLAGNATQSLFLASENGDRLFRFDDAKKQIAEVTATHKLISKSKVAAWGDVNRDGRLDLVSGGSNGVIVYLQEQSGAFKAGPSLNRGAIPGEICGLLTLDPGHSHALAVLAVSDQTTLLWNPLASNATAPAKFDGAQNPAKDLGALAAVLAADLDGDNLPDLLRVYANGSLISQGKAVGQFAPAQASQISAGPGRTGAFLGDYDADGRLDVFTVSAEGPTKLWNNCGKFEFKDTFALAGELSYKGEKGAIGGQTCDFNGDGRQDVFFYFAESSIHLYFNRGFRSFGHANILDPGSNGLLPQGDNGQQAACMCDLDGDGAQELILILKNGEAWVFPFAGGDKLGRSVRATLASNGPFAGPLTATGWWKGRCLGAWNVSAGTEAALVAVEEPGAVTLKWRFPGDKLKEQKVVIENNPRRLVLTP